MAKDEYFVLSISTFKYDGVHQDEDFAFESLHYDYNEAREAAKAMALKHNGGVTTIVLQNMATFRAQPAVVEL